jgi:hypothetical protein
MIMGVCCALLSWSPSRSAEAGSLSSTLRDVTDIQLEVPTAGTPHTAHFSTDAQATLGAKVAALAAQAGDFPATSTAPGFTYRYNPEAGMFERSSASLGPVFVERPQTTGRGKFDLGVSYLFVEFTEIDGDDMDELSFTGLEHNDCCDTTSPPPSAGDPAFERDTADIFFEKFNIISHVVSFSGTYGITDRWDVNLLLPVVRTQLDVRVRKQLNDVSGANTHFFPDGNTVNVDTVEDDANGVGDLLLRTKYHLLDTNMGKAPTDLGLGLTLRLPTGDQDDFQGLGDTIVTPFLTGSSELGPVGLFANVGFDVNADDLDRSRVRYAGNATIRLMERLALLVGAVGSSNLTTQTVSVTIPQFVNVGNRTDVPPSQAGVNLPDFVTAEESFKTNIVDLALGLKANPFGSVTTFVSFLVPVTDDGIRADFVPAAGVEMTF